MFQAGFRVGYFGRLPETATESQPKAKHIIDVDGGEEGDLGCAEATLLGP